MDQKLTAFKEAVRQLAKTHGILEEGQPIVLKLYLGGRILSICLDETSVNLRMAPGEFFTAEALKAVGAPNRLSIGVSNAVVNRWGGV